MKITGNEPANPVNEETTDRIDSGIKIYTGLTIRQQFAMAAMQGLMANDMPVYEIDNFNKVIVKMAVDTADALIAELNRTEADNV